ncbi:hypothetical protein QQF64_029435 [Cirrhinus molitorella]|uniref:Uncharacterized protein n=1 Tax=Cirrhinus molitorella TaxID=172907 RepID=A0ABR3N0J9_9TELE
MKSFVSGIKNRRMRHYLPPLTAESSRYNARLAAVINFARNCKVAARCVSMTDDAFFPDACLEVEVVRCFPGKLQNTLASKDPSSTSPLGAGTGEGCQKHKTPVVQSSEACTLILSGCEQSLIRVKRGERGGGKGDEIIEASRTTADRAVQNTLREHSREKPVQRLCRH